MYKNLVLGFVVLLCLTIVTGCAPTKLTSNTSSVSSSADISVTGRWFTPHAAARSIMLFEGQQFSFAEGGTDAPLMGNFTVQGPVVTLFFDNKRKDLELTFTTDSVAAYLKNDQEGEYFVKQ